MTAHGSGVEVLKVNGWGAPSSSMNELTERERRIEECVAYDAPWLTLRLCQHGIARDQVQANALFLELKRYLLLAEQQGDRAVPMFSLRIDEVWHQFILFTAEYTAFCQRYFGHYLHHMPEQVHTVAQGLVNEQLTAPVSLEHFRGLYAQAFGPVSELWTDDCAVDVTTRLTRAVDGLCCRESSEVVELVRAVDERVVCRVGRRAACALEFIAATPVFMVRELPGLNSDAERVKLVRPLVQYGVLRLKY